VTALCILSHELVACFRLCSAIVLLSVNYLHTYCICPFVVFNVTFQLLLYICGSKEKYRQLRDMNFLETHMSSVRSICEKCGCDPSLSSPITTVSLSYDVLIDLVSNQLHV